MMRAVDLSLAVPLAIFVFTYLVFAIGNFPGLKLDRTGAALAGALLMVVTGSLSEAGALAAIDFHTLVLLLGMMIIVANLRVSGAFALVARWLLEQAHKGYALLAMTVLASGVLAAFFINDVVCLSLAGPLIEVARILEIDAAPLLIALATGSNIGSVATITGNPQNMIVAGFAHIGYSAFAIRLAPVAVASLLVDYAVIAWLYHGRLSRIRRRDDLHLPAPPPERRYHLIKSSTVAGAVLVLFAMGYPTHLVALGGGAALLFTRRTQPRSIYEQIDWTLLVMFAGLFIVVRGAETTHLLEDLVRAAGPERLKNVAVLSVAAAVLSNLVSNVPAVLLFKPIYPQISQGMSTGLVLASASTLAGNLTLLGSIANLIVIEQARREGIEISFIDYLKVGLPVTLVTLAIDIAWLQFLR
ncbi:MAG: SLC13 family permease [Candidatus Binataceae bacterium]|jgi:Na+/H+ antiporter NhaD/arsenite permease-like protein